MANDRSNDWLRQAKDDMGWAHDTFDAERWSQACYIAQQIGEKALMALAMRRGADRVRSHSIADIAKALAINGEIERAAKRLDQYYMTTRYPDALPSGAPFEYFDREQAAEALAYAENILSFVEAAWLP
jgi:HEPN domain-containing protein